MCRLSVFTSYIYPRNNVFCPAIQSFLKNSLVYHDLLVAALLNSAPVVTGGTATFGPYLSASVLHAELHTKSKPTASFVSV